MNLQQPISQKLYDTSLKTIAMANMIFSLFIGKTIPLPLLSPEIAFLCVIMLIAAYFKQKTKYSKVAFSIITICFLSLSVILIAIGTVLIINGNQLLCLRYFAVLLLVFLCWYGAKWRLLTF